MLHDAANHHLFTVRDGIDVDLDCRVEEVVEQHWRIVGDLDRMGHVVLQLGGVVDNLHGAAAKDVARAHHQRVTDRLGLGEGLFKAACCRVGWLLEPQLDDHLLEALAVFGAVNGVRRGTDDRHAGSLQLTRKLERGLATELHDHPDRLLLVSDLQYVLKGYRLEIEAVRGVVVGRHGLRVAVDHDGFIAILTHGNSSMHAAVIKLDALADAVGPAPQHHDLAPLGHLRLALLLVGGVEIGGIRGELGGTGINPLVDRTNAGFLPRAPELLLGNPQQFGQPRIREALALEPEQLLRGKLGERALCYRLLKLDQFFELHQEPGVDLGQAKDLLHAHTGTHGIGDIENTLGTRRLQLTLDQSHVFRCEISDYRIEPVITGFEPTQGFLQRLLESTANSHYLAHRLHLGSQTIVGLGEFLEGEARNLGDDVVDGGLERGRGTPTGNVVLQLIQGIAHRQLGGDLGDGETGSLGSQCRRARHPRVHLDDHHAPGLRVNTELYVGTTRFDTDLAQHRKRCVTHDLVLFVGQRLRRRYGDGIPRMHAHRVKVFDRANDDAVVVLVTNDLHLVLLPAQ